jgi:glycosyltransferase involved in cell wall biosynthesis
MVSVIIASHDEEAVIGQCLDALALGGTRGEVIVSANGCSDGTARVADARGAIVIDRTESGKPGALNAAEKIATSFPRIYLDADILVPPGGLAQLIAALDAQRGILAVVPSRHVDTTDRPWPVRAYFRIQQHLPVFRSGLFGRGLIVVSEPGRSRFDEFPTMTADDLFLDAQFSAAEKHQVADVEVVVQAPWTTRALVNRLTRVRRGNTEMRHAAAEHDVEAAVRNSDRWSWLRDVVLPDPRLLPDAAAYVVITLLAGYRARRTPTADWGRDASTRTPLPADTMPRPEGAV